MVYNPEPREAGAQAMYNLGTEYLKAAKLLEKHHMNTLMPHGPLYYIITHSFELITKSYLLSKGLKYKDLKNIGHKASKVVAKCAELGMEVGPSEQMMIEVVENINAHDMQRYPMCGHFKIGPQGFSEPKNLIA